MPTLYANGIHIEYDIYGSGEPLILIAGLGYDRWAWHKMIAGLASNFRVIAFDNRGVGGTDKPAGPYTAQLLAQDTAELLKAVGVEKTAVLSHSMGGFVAQAFALNYPQMVSKLILSATNFGGPNHIPVAPEALVVLMDTTSDPITRLKNGIRVSTAPGFAKKHPEIVEAWLTYRQTHPIDLAGYQAQLAIGLGLLTAENCFEHKLPAIQAPTLILFGEHDKVVPSGNAPLLARQIPNSTIHILPGAGHFYPFETPETAVSVITSFLQGGDYPSSPRFP